MSSKPIAIPNVPSSLMRSEEELPFVSFQEGVDFQLLHADIESAIWVVRVRAQPGATIPRHKHTGEVFAFTIKGEWKYLEYPEVNTAGSYLYEPAGSIHTLHVLETNQEITEVWFAVRGANLNLDDEGKVEFVLDAASVLELYHTRCQEAGYGAPNVIAA